MVIGGFLLPACVAVCRRFRRGGRSPRALRHCIGGQVVCGTVFSERRLFSPQVLDQVRAWVQQRWRHEVLQFARQLQEWTEQERSERQSVTPCPGSGSFARRLLLVSPYCRTSSVGGGRSAVSRFLPEPLNPSPGRSAGPGFLARRMGSKRCMCSCFLVGLCSAVLQLCFPGCFLAPSWLKLGHRLKLRLLVNLGVESRMASKASSSKGDEELVGQELARSLWTQGLSETEAGRKQTW